MSLPDNKKFLNAFLCVPGVGYETMSRLKKFFPSYETAWQSDTRGFKAADIQEKTIEAITRTKARINPDDEMTRLIKGNVTLLTDNEPDFPELLREIHSPPMWLYIKGGTNLNSVSLAVVGSRKATSYGREATKNIIAGLSELTDITITSGLAMGIDAQAHISSLKHSLPTIAVVGTGLDRQSFFPPKNIRLAEEIISRGGAVISEYPLGTPALKHNFIQRNRVISGLAKGALIVEAAEKSGALITARFALEQGREVFVVPGSIFSPYSRGVNALLKEGATPVSSATDIADELNLPQKTLAPNARTILTNENEKNILKTLLEPLGVDEMQKKSGISIPDIISCLSMLELKGLVKNMRGEWTKI